MGRGVWQATVMGLERVTQLDKWLPLIFSRYLIIYGHHQMILLRQVASPITEVPMLIQTHTNMAKE